MIGDLLGLAFGGLAKGALLKAETRGRTDEQQAVIKYFNTEGGCFGGGFFGFKDKDFDKVLEDKVQEFDIYQMALNKLCVEESKVKEISPILLDGYYYDHNRSLGDALGTGKMDGKSINVIGDSADRVGTYVKAGKDNLIRFSKYKLTCVLCSVKQMYLYSFRFDLTNLSTREEVVEIFYKDIDSVEVVTRVNDQAIPAKGCLGFLQPPKYETYTYPELKITVPGNFFTCSMRVENENAMMGLKNLIRDKKGQQ